MGHYHIRIKQLAYPMQQPLLYDVELSLAHDAFTIIAGENGCGKTTLLRLLKPQLHPAMHLEGEILWEEEGVCQPVEDLPDDDSAAWIGYVAQDPASQMVSDQVWHELAFGLENLGMESEQIHQRIAETVTFFGMEEWYHMPISSLSGGQKQLLNLACVLCMRPKVILLDEAASQLDPIARQHFLDMLQQIHEEYAIGIIMVEHTLEPLLSKCDRILYLDRGRVAYDGGAAQLCTCTIKEEALLPYPARWGRSQQLSYNPVTIKDMLQADLQTTPASIVSKAAVPVLDCRHVYFRYEKEGKEILRDLALRVHQHEIFCLFGGNGSGKTSLLKLLGAKQRQRFGDIQLRKRLLYLPQDPRILFVKDCLRDEFAAYLPAQQQLLDQLKLTHVIDHHPYDLSGGELQRAGLAYLLMQLQEEEVFLLLDEPTKGLDMACKEALAQIFQQLVQSHTILMVSHDVEFAALCADRCGLLFDGAISSIKPTKAFFQDQYFYTTYWYRITRSNARPAYTYQEIKHVS